MEMSSHQRNVRDPPSRSGPTTTLIPSSSSLASLSSLPRRRRRRRRRQSPRPRRHHSHQPSESCACERFLCHSTVARCPRERLWLYRRSTVLHSTSTYLPRISSSSSSRRTPFLSFNHILSCTSYPPMSISSSSSSSLPWPTQTHLVDQLGPLPPVMPPPPPHGAKRKRSAVDSRLYFTRAEIANQTEIGPSIPFSLVFPFLPFFSYVAFQLSTEAAQARCFDSDNSVYSCWPISDTVVDQNDATQFVCA